MSPRARVFGIVGLVAAGAAGVTVGVTLLTTRGEHRAAPTTTAASRAGRPPLLLDLGVRTDPEARALRGASALYEVGRSRSRPASIRQAAAIFRRYRSLEAQVGSALADWPAGASRLHALARSHPRSGVAALHDGLALVWLGHVQDARLAWRR